MINGTVALLGDTIDIAYVGFFSSTDAAWAYYEAYREEYSLPRPSVANFKINFDAGYVTVNGTKYIERGMGATDKPLEIDYTGATLNSVDSVSVGGWCVTPGGVKTYSYYVIDKATGVRSKIKLLVTVTDENTGAIRNEGLKANYPTSCGLGAGFQGFYYFDLSAYKDKTVDVEMVIVTNWGAEAVVAKLTNITVPAAE
jgi:hypothetical protein